MLPAMSCAVLNAKASVCNVLIPHVFAFCQLKWLENTYALLPHVAEDEIASSDDDSSDSEESDIEVDVAQTVHGMQTKFTVGDKRVAVSIIVAEAHELTMRVHYFCKVCQFWQCSTPVHTSHKDVHHARWLHVDEKGWGYQAVPR